MSGNAKHKAVFAGFAGTMALFACFLGSYAAEIGIHVRASNQMGPPTGLEKGALAVLPFYSIFVALATIPAAATVAFWKVGKLPWLAALSTGVAVALGTLLCHVVMRPFPRRVLWCLGAAQLFAVWAIVLAARWLYLRLFGDDGPPVPDLRYGTPDKGEKADA